MDHFIPGAPISPLEEAQGTIDVLRDLILEINGKADDPKAVRALVGEAITVIDGDEE